MTSRSQRTHQVKQSVPYGKQKTGALELRHSRARRNNVRFGLTRRVDNGIIAGKSRCVHDIQDTGARICRRISRCHQEYVQVTSYTRTCNGALNSLGYGGQAHLRVEDLSHTKSPDSCVDILEIPCLNQLSISVTSCCTAKPRAKETRITREDHGISARGNIRSKEKHHLAL